jgi:signal transduction histidine kinase/ligand-binding sensor domain-containing protein
MFGMSDGLPSAGIDCIVRDSAGYLWFCTEEGLARFDGLEFRVYGAAQGLPDREATGLVQTPDGEYWVSTFKGLARFDPFGASRRSGFFEVFRPPGTPEASHILLVRAAPDGKLWCSTQAGLYSFDRRTRRFLRVLAPPPSDAWWSAVMPDADGSLWLGSSSLYHLLPDGHLEHYGPAEGLLSNVWRVSDLLRTRDGRLWVATWKGLYRMVERPIAGKPSVDAFYDERSGLPNHDIFSLFQSSTGRLLVGLQRAGVYEFVPGPVPGQAGHFRNFAGLGSLYIPEVGTPSIDYIGEDLEGNIWLSRAIRVARSGFVSYGLQDGLRTTNIGSIFEDRAGHLISLSCDPRCRFVNVFDGTRFHASEARLGPGVKQVTWGYGQIHFQDHTGIWWLATEEGLCRYPRGVSAADLGRALPERTYTHRDGLPADGVFSLFEDSRGDIWISQLGINAVTRWNRTTDDFETFRYDRQGRALSPPTVFAEDHAGNIWAGPFSPGLIRINGSRIDYFADDATDSAVQALFVDHSGRLWVGTNRAGALRVDDPASEHPHFRALTAKDGLASNQVRAFTEDLHGRIYLGTGRGIDRLDLATGSIRHYTYGDGLGFSARARVAFRDRNGALWFGDEGLLRFDPEAASGAGPPRPVRILRVTVRGKPHAISELGESDVTLPPLAATDNDVELEFASMNFAVGQTIRYQYRIEGKDAEWTAPIGQRSLRLASLAAGTYRLLVRAVNSDGVFTPSPATLSFEILPPWWRRWWFFTSAVFLGVAVSVVAYRYRVRQLLLIERIRGDIAMDLHDDIGSTLSQISLLTAVAGLNRRTERIDADLCRIGELARGLVDSMSEIVWALNPRQDNLGGLAAHMRRFASDVLASSGISFRLTTPSSEEEQQLRPDLRRHVFLVFKECVHNIVRHSAARHVEAALSISRHSLRLEVRDDGKGFDPGLHYPGNGLASMTARAARMGGVLMCISEPMGGTTVLLTAPLRGNSAPSLPVLVAAPTPTREKIGANRDGNRNSDDNGH